MSRKRHSKKRDAKHAVPEEILAEGSGPHGADGEGPDAPSVEVDAEALATAAEEALAPSAAEGAEVEAVAMAAEIAVTAAETEAAADAAEAAADAAEAAAEAEPAHAAEPAEPAHGKKRKKGKRSRGDAAIADGVAVAAEAHASELDAMVARTAEIGDAEAGAGEGEAVEAAAGEPGEPGEGEPRDAEALDARGEAPDASAETLADGEAAGEPADGELAAEGEAALDPGEPGEDGDAVEGVVLPQGATAMDAQQLKHLVEALIFAADKPVTLQRIRQLTRVSDVKRLEQALATLAHDYADRGISLQQVSGGYQFRTNTHYSGWVQQLIAGRPVRLSRAQLETLAIIAYRQPITRPEIDEIRGVDSSSTLRVLLDRSLVRILGKREEVGRPTLYGTTKEFLDFFSLGDLRELPTLREYSELTAESRQVISDRLGVGLDEQAAASGAAAPASGGAGEGLEGVAAGLEGAAAGLEGVAADLEGVADDADDAAAAHAVASAFHDVEMSDDAADQAAAIAAIAAVTDAADPSNPAGLEHHIDPLALAIDPDSNLLPDVDPMADAVIAADADAVAHAVADAVAEADRTEAEAEVVAAAADAIESDELDAAAAIAADHVAVAEVITVDVEMVSVTEIETEIESETTADEPGTAIAAEAAAPDALADAAGDAELAFEDAAAEPPEAKSEVEPLETASGAEHASGSELESGSDSRPLSAEDAPATTYELDDTAGSDEEPHTPD